MSEMKYAGETILDRLRAHAQNQPDRIAYRFLRENAGSDTLTFGQLEQRVRGLAARFCEHASPGDRALLLYPPGLAFIEAFLGCLAAGIIAIPAYPPRANRKAERQWSIIEDASPSLILTSSQVAPKNRLRIPPGSRSPYLVTDELMFGGDSDWRAPTLGPSTVAFLQYTSGSTGAPRGVMITHGNIAANEQQVEASFCHRQDSVVVSWLPLFHDMGLIGGVLQPLYVGFPAVLMSPVTFLREPVEWLRAISRYRGTTSGAPNFAYDHCVKYITEEQKKGLDLSSWQIAYNGAEPVRGETLDRFTDAFAGCGFRPEVFFPCYGLAEATLFVSGGPPNRTPARIYVADSSLEAHRLVEVPADDPEARQLVSSGRAGGEIRVLIVDPETGTECPPDKVGEIWLASASVASGYWHCPDETKKTFGARLARTGEGPFLRTGDLGFSRDGELVITGRLKDLIIVRGRNLYPQDIEAAVEQAVDFVRANSCAAVCIYADGEEKLAIVAEADRRLVQTAQAAKKERSKEKPDGSADGTYSAHAELDALVMRVRHVVGEAFDVMPHTVTFVLPGTFPRTSSGKVQRRVCRESLINGKLEVVHAWCAGSVELVLQPACEMVTRRNPTGHTAGLDNLPSATAESSRARADAMIAWFRAFAESRLNSRLADDRRMLPPPVVLELGNHGFFGLQVPIELEGRGLLATDTQRVLQQLAAVDLSLAIMVGGHNGLGLRPLLQHLSVPEQKRLIPPLATGRQIAAFAFTEPAAGSNPNAILSTASCEGDTWRLRGEKRWIGSASWASWLTVLARVTAHNGTSQGLTAFLVDGLDPGVRIGPESMTMGARAIVQNRVFLNGATVPDSRVLGQVGQGMRVAQDAMNYCRFGISALGIGVMKRAAQILVRYAGRRSVSTGRLLDNPITLERLHALTAAISASEALVEAVAKLLDAGGDVPAELFAACKATTPELAFQAVDTLMQGLGGRGYEETSGVPQLFRDSRLLRIFEGPTETMLMFLGSSGLQNEQTVRKLLDASFGDNRLASEVLAVFEQMKATLTATQAGVNAASQWQMTCYLAGDILASALLTGAAQHRLQAASTEGLAAVTWTRERFELSVRKAADRIGASPTRSSEAIIKTVQAYANAIGDVEQELPGEEVDLDPLLSRSGTRSSEMPFVPASLGTGNGMSQNPPPRRVQLDGSANNLLLVRSTLRSRLRGGCPDLESGVVDDVPFAQLGLDSVSAVGVIVDIESATGRRLSPDLLYEFSSIGQLARYLDRELETRPGTEDQASLAGSALAAANDLAHGGQRTGGVDIRFVSSPEELEAVYRFRYTVYVEEMKRTQVYADHVKKLITDPLDTGAHVLAAFDREAKVIGTLRTNLLRESDVGQYRELYGLDQLSVEESRSTSISTRLMVAPEFRDGSLPVEMAKVLCKFSAQQGITADFADCNLPVLGFFLGLGYQVFRPCVHHPEYGDVVVVRLDMADLDHLRKVRSPLLAAFESVARSDEVAQVAANP